MCLDGVWASGFVLDGREMLLEGVILAALFSTGRTEPCGDFTGVDRERSAMAYYAYWLLRANALGMREWRKD